MNDNSKRPVGAAKSSRKPSGTAPSKNAAVVRKAAGAPVKSKTAAPAAAKRPQEIRKGGTQKPIRDTAPAYTYTSGTVSDKKAGTAGGARLSAKKVYLIVIAVLVVINIFAITGITQRKIPERMSAQEVESSSFIDLDAMFEPPFDTAKVYSADFAEGTLALVNGTYAMNQTNIGRDIPEPALAQVNRHITDRNYKARDNTTQLNIEVIDALNLMMADFTAAGGPKDVMVNEAYRTYEVQKSIYDSYVKEYGQNQKIAQIPGYSEHHTGYAIDFLIYRDNGRGSKRFTPEPDYLWIYQNCHKYGFILRYPEGKTEITGIDPESWHFRYVGVPHAAYIYERGITLEEYLSEIRIYTENAPLTINASGEEYGVYYVKRDIGEYTEFNVPKEKEYFISGDNMGGFVVWYKTGSADGGNAE